MKNLRGLLAVLFMIFICISSFARRVPLHGKGTLGDKKKRSISLDVPIIADIDETSKVLSLEFLEYIGEVRVSVTDTDGNDIVEETAMSNVKTKAIEQVKSRLYNGTDSSLE